MIKSAQGNESRINGGRGAEPVQHVTKKKREMTLTIGLFFDGTGNNANNSGDRLAACAAENFGMSDAESESALSESYRLNPQFSGSAATSYFSHYTNIHWLNTLYKQDMTPETGIGQHAIYIEGIGTEDGLGDSIWGMSTGRGDTGVIGKTDKAVSLLAAGIQSYLRQHADADSCVIKELQFDLFGFSRGAAAARHFANRVFSQDVALIAAIKAGLSGAVYSGSPAGKTRFLGLFDTVAAIGTPVNGFNPNSANTGKVNLMLRPGVAERVFHITAQHECRFNFALNSVKPAWPELALPGVHADIGGGYHPEEHEVYFLTRPQFETVAFATPDSKTRVYRQAGEQLRAMAGYPAIAPLLRKTEAQMDTWHDGRMPADRYGTLQKRSGAAAVINRLTHNDWAKVALRVMRDAAQDAGVVFDALVPGDNPLSVSSELSGLCEKAIAIGRAIRLGRSVNGFTTPEIEMLAEKYIHCSANWNSVVRDRRDAITGAVRPAKRVTFTNRPDYRWQRTVYDMSGRRVRK